MSDLAACLDRLQDDLDRLVDRGIRLLASSDELLRVLDRPGDRPKVLAALEALETSPGWLEALVRELVGGPLRDRVYRLDLIRQVLGPEFSGEAFAGVEGNARLSLFGTDGCRGEVGPDEEQETLERAVAGKLRDHSMTPALFEAIPMAIVEVLREDGYELRSAVVGWDTRDLHVGSCHEGIFQEAVIDGVRYAGLQAIVLGTTPIANTCYALARLAEEHPGLCLGFNKTASHNPPTHDGLKSFVLEPDGRVRKLRPEEEARVTARIVAGALDGFPEIRPGPTMFADELALRSFAGVLAQDENADLPGRPLHVAALIYDGANGAAGSPETAEGILGRLRELAGRRPVVILGDAPDGRNSPAGCGAGALEGITALDDATRLRAYPEHATLARMFDEGRGRAEGGRADGRLVFGLCVDGDSDRSIVCFYDPFADLVRFIDGDAAIILQVERAIAAGRLAPGQRIAFTIESSASFVECLRERCLAALPTELVRYGEKTNPEALSLIVTPVGDKWILETGAIIGGEATGHVIRPARLSPGGPLVAAGNGVLGCLATLAALEQRILAVVESEGPAALAELLPGLARPYPEDLSQASYVYFVERAGFYRGSPIWLEVCTLVQAALDRHAGAYTRSELCFEEDPNTYAVLLREGEQLVASIHLRCSGTEAKVGCKASALPRPELAALLKDLDESLTLALARAMQDPRSREGRWQVAALTALLAGSLSWKELVADLGADPSQAKALRNALRKQKLVSQEADGCLSISPRGRILAAALGS